MKRIFLLLLTVIVCLSFVACNEESGTMKEDIKYYKLGETVKTDIFEFTLNSAKFTVALNNVNDDNRFTPKEYNPTEDADNPYVAPMGHTYAAFSYTVTNLNRASSEFHRGSFATVKYDNKEYKSLKEGAYFLYADKHIMQNGSMKTEKAGKWYNYPSNNFNLSVGEKGTRRAYIDISTDIKDLTEDVEITFAIPNSDGTKTKFTYLITEADRTENTGKEIEMSLDLALVSFTKDDGQTYFKDHMNDFGVMSGSEIDSAVNGKRKNVVMILSYGSWEGTFAFEADGRIKETIPKVGTGYFNSRTWSINEDTLILDNEDVCQVRKINDSTYLLVKDNEPYAILN